MRIETGPKGQVIGTKRVNAAGQIVGLKPYAGQDVLLVLADGRAEMRKTLRDHAGEARVMLAQRLEEANLEIQKVRKTLRRKGGREKILYEYVPEKAAQAVESASKLAKESAAKLQQRVAGARQRLEGESKQRLDRLESAIREFLDGVADQADSRRKKVTKRATKVRSGLEDYVEAKREEFQDQARKVRARLDKQVRALRGPNGSAKRAAAPAE